MEEKERMRSHNMIEVDLKNKQTKNTKYTKERKYFFKQKDRGRTQNESFSADRHDHKHTASDKG